MRKTFTYLKVFNILAFIAMVVVNFLANRIPIGGYTTGEVSELYPNLFTPAGITFGIWGVIYILLGAFVIYQGKGLFTKSQDQPYFIDQIGGWFILSCIANISWIYAWHNLKIPLALALMIILLFSLVKIYTNLNIGKVKVEKKVRLFVHLPFQIYLGWITIATIANITTLLVYFGWDGMGFSAVIWTIGTLILGTIITYLVLKTRGDTVYSLVVLWAYLGIIIKRLSEEPNYSAIIITATLCMALIVFFMAFRRR